MDLKDRLEKLGFKKLSKSFTGKEEIRDKMKIAYKTFPFIEQGKVDSYNKKLVKKNEILRSYRIENYDDGIPDDKVLDSLEKAKELKCFDYYEVMRVEQQKDPILFGRINGCPDRFYIDQWGSDVRVEDILMQDK